MSQRHALRLGGATAITGGVLTFVGNIFHPREPGQLDSAANLFNVVVHHQMWVADHLMIAMGLSLLLHGFYGVTQSIHTAPGAVWARFAWHMAALGVLFGLGLMLTEAIAVTSLAHAWHGAVGAEKDLVLAAGNAVFEMSLTFSVGACYSFLVRRRSSTESPCLPAARSIARGPAGSACCLGWSA